MFAEFNADCWPDHVAEATFLELVEYAPGAPRRRRRGGRPRAAVPRRGARRRGRVALAQLSDDQQEVLALRFAAEMTSREIADITGRSIGAVKALQHRGLASLERIPAAEPDG